MTAEDLDQSFHRKKAHFHDYISKIKQNAPWDIFTIVNPTLIKNPYASSFPKLFFENDKSIRNKIFFFLFNTIKFYTKSFYLFNSYLLAFMVYKIYYKKQRKRSVKTIIDVFGLVNKTIEEDIFNENYLTGIYEVFERYNKHYTLLLRLYGISKNPLKLRKFFQIINEDKRDFIFEFEFLLLKDFIELFVLIIAYPFKTLRLIQKESTSTDNIFNQSLFNDLKYVSFDGFTRYLFGKNIARIDTIETVYSWSEFQVIERSFNFAIRKKNTKIQLIACQFYLNYETYFNSYIDELDDTMQFSPHKVLVNGKYYILDRKKVLYKGGVSLRYKNIFNFKGIIEEKNILLLGSYIEKDTQYMLESVKSFDKIIFKNHPAVNTRRFGQLPKNITISNENIYTLFENAKFVLATASGTAVEAVACGISVIIVASQNNLTANPLVDYGKGKIWDIAYTRHEVQIHYNKLLRYREEHPEEILEIARWYKNNFFIEPTEENILNVFGITKERE